MRQAKAPGNRKKISLLLFKEFGSDVEVCLHVKTKEKLFKTDKI